MAALDLLAAAEEGAALLADRDDHDLATLTLLTLDEVQRGAVDVGVKATGEAAIGLAILVVYFRNRGSIAVEDINMMKG